MFVLFEQNVEKIAQKEEKNLRKSIQSGIDSGEIKPMLGMILKLGSFGPSVYFNTVKKKKLPHDKVKQGYRDLFFFHTSCLLVSEKMMKKLIILSGYTEREVTQSMFSDLMKFAKSIGVSDELTKSYQQTGDRVQQMVGMLMNLVEAPKDHLDAYLHLMVSNIQSLEEMLDGQFIKWRESSPSTSVRDII